MIDPTTEWYKTVKYNDKQEDMVYNLVYKELLFRYQRLTMNKYN